MTAFNRRTQIRKLSVKRITSPLVYDNLKNAVPNGLYDAAMGPMETNDRHERTLSQLDADVSLACAVSCAL